MDHDLTHTWDLVRKAQDGDGPALERLFARYYERVRRIVRARLGPALRARMETADILQPAFTKAFQNFDRFEMRDEASLLQWLAEYARHQLHDAADQANAKKRRAPAPPMPLDGSDDSPRVELRATGPSPASQAGVNEQEAAIAFCLAQLPAHYREVIVLRDYNGLDWQQIARQLGKNTDSAARELYRCALVDLAAALARRGFGPGAR